MDNLNYYSNNKSENISIFSLKYGVLLAIILFVIYLINYSTAYSLNFLGYFNHIAIILIISIGAISYKKKFLNGFISYKKALSISLLISMYGLIFFSIIFYLFLKFFDTVIMDLLRQEAYNKIADNPHLQNTNLDNIDILINKMLTPFMFSLSNFLGLMFYSIFYSLIASAFIRKTDNSFEANFKKYKNEYFNNNTPS